MDHFKKKIELVPIQLLLSSKLASEDSCLWYVLYIL